MEYKYFIEFLGVLVSVYAHFFTQANPYVMGISYFAIYMIGSSIGADQFSPLITTTSYFLGRTTTEEALYALASQFLAVAAIIITFQPLKVLMDSA